MARCIIRRPSFWKMVGAYRSQWKRSLKRMFIPGYGKRGMGKWRNPRKAWYNWWYYRTSISAYRLIGHKPSRGFCMLAMTFALFANAFAIPLDLAKAIVKANRVNKRVRKIHKKRNSSGTSGRTSTVTKHTRTNTCQTSHTNAVQLTTSCPMSKSVPSRTSASSSVGKNMPKVEVKPIHAIDSTFAPTFSKAESADSFASQKAEEPKIPDENIPKSSPMHEGDQYIRKRMMVAGSHYCDQAVVSRLFVDAYIQLVAEPDNPYDKNAIALYYEGAKIGYVAKTDAIPLANCLKLGRSIYGVITDIREQDGRREAEYEAWFLRTKN